jgi:MoaA/NifB/PqqE/SkfB family radical SAM enzyme
MRTNFDRMDKLVALARRNGTNLRVNVYQAVKSDVYTLTYDEFWEGYRRLFAEGLVLSCSEPVVRAVLGLDGVQSPCGRNSIRFNPRGQIIPCVYWPVDPSATPCITDLVEIGAEVLANASFQTARQTPASAADCPCQGGCASRRALNGGLDAHDIYCPWVRGDTIKLDWRPAPAKELIRSRNVCTTIVV